MIDSHLFTRRNNPFVPYRKRTLERMVTHERPMLFFCLMLLIYEHICNKDIYVEEGGRKRRYCETIAWGRGRRMERTWTFLLNSSDECMTSEW